MKVNLKQERSQIGQRFAGAEAGKKGAYRVVIYASRFALETVYGLALSVELVTIGIYN